MILIRDDAPGGRTRLLKRLVDYKSIRPKIWYLPVLLLAPLMLAATYWIMRLTGRPMPTPDIPILWAIGFFVLFFVGAAAEEAGWSGYVTDPVQRRWGALGAGLIIGFIWGLWHAVGWYILTRHDLTWTAGQGISTIALPVLIVWLYNNTGRSVFAAVICHDTANVSEFLFPNFGSPYDPVLFGLVAAIVATTVTVLGGPRTLADYRHQRGTSEAQPR
jgi:membrane protease YdiL (CAAX protease family)